mgnify:CR=1 FL=1
MMDTLFLLPFISGLCFALLLPLLGCYLRLRNEWLAALAYSNVSASGALGALALGVPLSLGGLLAAISAAGLKRSLRGRLAQGTAYGLLLLLGWAGSILLTANLPMAERLGHALFDGQLYFTGLPYLLLALVTLVGGGIALRLLSRHLLLAHVFPQLAIARGCGGRHDFAFDLLVAVVLALATMVLGVMAAFALTLIPAWAAFAGARHWRSNLRWALAIGLGAYLAAFVLALWLDQPFGPVLAVTLVVLGGILVLPRRDCATARNMLKV